jgi:Ca-activated chloride channel family protein
LIDAALPSQHGPMLRACLCALWATFAVPVLAGAADGTCETALVLAIDVSNSVDENEYRLQVDGLVEALRDPMIAEALVDGQVALSVMQWSGARDQRVSIPWRRMTSPAEVALMAGTLRSLPRAFIRSGTAPGDAVRRGLDLMAEVSDCARQVIDVSGDGQRNMGSDVARARDAAEAAGVTVNAIAIETAGNALSYFFRRELITSDGFVMSAQGHWDYPNALRRKIRRELSPPVG